jgi:hypothetical protein
MNAKNFLLALLLFNVNTVLYAQNQPRWMLRCGMELTEYGRSE